MDHNHSTHTHEGNVHEGIPIHYTFKHFVPLIVIFIGILLFTGLIVFWQGNTSPEFAMRMFMAGFFLVFGLFKISKWKGFANAYQVYDLIAKHSRFYAYLYPLIELGLGIAYLVGWNLPVTNIITLAVMLISAAGVFNELQKKNQIPCACLGTVFKIPMTKVTLLEDLLMALMAGIMLL